MEFILDSRPALAELQKPSTRAVIRTVRFGGPLTDATMERRLNATYAACGCEEGSVAMMAVLLTSICLGLWSGFDGHLAWWRILAYVFVAALIGKVTGVTVRRVRLRRLYRWVEIQLRNYEAGPAGGPTLDLDADASLPQGDRAGSLFSDPDGGADAPQRA